MRFLPILILLCLACAPQSKPDSKKIERIVSLSPHITEIIYALNQQDRLIAVTDFCNYPPQAKQKLRIGGLLNPNLEKMVSLHADLFIGTPAHQSLADRLAAQNIRSVLFANDRISDITASIDSLGRLLGCPEQAKSLNQKISDSLKVYRQQAAQLSSHPRALFVIGREPGSTRKLTAVGSGSFITTLWDTLGGKNIFTTLPTAYSLVSREAVVNANPDLIIEFKYLEKWNEDRQNRNIREWSALKNISAVRGRKIYVITADYSLIPGPRLYLLARDYLHILKDFDSNIMARSAKQ